MWNIILDFDERFWCTDAILVNLLITIDFCHQKITRTSKFLVLLPPEGGGEYDLGGDTLVMMWAGGALTIALYRKYSSSLVN